MARITKSELEAQLKDARSEIAELRQALAKMQLRAERAEQRKLQPQPTRYLIWWQSGNCYKSRLSEYPTADAARKAYHRCAERGYKVVALLQIGTRRSEDVLLEGELPW